MRRTLKYGQNPQQAAFVRVDMDSHDPLALAQFKTPSGYRISSKLSAMTLGARSTISAEVLMFSFGLRKPANSTVIAIAKGGRLLASAAGEQERAAACEEAIAQVRRNRKAVSLKEAAVASDGYFTFADGIDALGRKKVKAIFATHGSFNDKEVAKHANSFDELIFHTVPDHVGRVFAGG